MGGPYSANKKDPCTCFCGRNGRGSDGVWGKHYPDKPARDHGVIEESIGAAAPLRQRMKTLMPKSWPLLRRWCCRRRQ